MGNIFHILGSATVFEFLSTITIVVGVGILIYWLIRNKGFSLVEFSPARVNKMRLHTPLMQLFIWIILIMLSGSLIRLRFEEPLSVQGQLAMSIAMLAVELGMIFSILVIAFMNFHGRFDGFGLNFRTLGKDIGWGAVNYVAAIPIIAVSMLIVIGLGKIFISADFELAKHESLELLTQIHVGFQIVVIFSAALVVPVFEELLFRGLIQTALRTHLQSPWLAIVLTSMVFVVMHGIWQHWLPLMALSVCMGYAYEKSGSILRSICIHVIFNSVSIAGVLLGAN
ncbi:MAG: CPBP family intramembrane metalloprotease [Planctomycetes bacterium]|nr:CPBP family intramembrane metalloprotease [Planctomycetota bacterium]